VEGQEQQGPLDEESAKYMIRKCVEYIGESAEFGCQLTGEWKFWPDRWDPFVQERIEAGHRLYDDQQQQQQQQNNTNRNDDNAEGMESNKKALEQRLTDSIYEVEKANGAYGAE
jgi:hypothetical protein